MKNLEEQLKEDMALIEKGAVEVIGKDDLKEKLANYYHNEKPLIIKLGLDPSAPDIHLGHTVVLRKIRQFQSLGHKAILIIGDFTGRIGDPTGKNKLRKQLSEKEVLINADTYKQQLLKVLDPEKTIICFNSEWLNTLSLNDLIQLMSKQSLLRMLERDSFKKRMASREAIFLHELLYPMLQGLDSLEIKADIEIGGTDQKFNLLMGRDMQAKEGLAKQAAIMMPLLVGLDGKNKMSKSLGNYVGVDEDACVMFEKLMQLPDEMIEEYFTLLTDYTVEQISDLMTRMKDGLIHPRDVKVQLAKEIVSLYHTASDTKKASERYTDVFTKGRLPEELECILLHEDDLIIPLIVKCGFAKSKSEARRLIVQKGVKVNQIVIEDISFKEFRHGDILQVGKRKFKQLIKD